MDSWTVLGNNYNKHFEGDEYRPIAIIAHLRATQQSLSLLGDGLHINGEGELNVKYHPLDMKLNE